MKFPAFAYARPHTVGEALQTLSEIEDSRPLAGGQSLLPLLALRLASPTLLVDLSGIDSLTKIEVRDGVVQIGAMLTHSRNAQSAENKRHLPLLVQALAHVAHEAVRNRGTIGGSVAHADASAEMPVIATALDATMVIESPGGERTVPAVEFFQGHYTTALAPGEVLTRLDFPCSTGTWAFEEVARRPGDFALVMAAAGLVLRDGRCGSVRIVLGSISDRPIRATEAESYLIGKPVTPQTIREAARIATHALPSRADIHASAEYRRSVANVIVRRALLTAASGGSHETH
jgi:CO/xanthine dehydrogenase FAD-binding subunit